MPLSSSMQTRGEATRVAAGISAPISGICWTADSRDSVASAGTTDVAALWRVRASEGSSAKLLGFAGEVPMSLSYLVAEIEWSLREPRSSATFGRLISMPRTRTTGAAVKAFDSTKNEYAPRFSPMEPKWRSHPVAPATTKSGCAERWLRL